MGDTVELTQRILRLFETDNFIGQPRKHNSCCVCGAQNIPDEVELSAESVKVLLKALLVEIGDMNRTEYSSTWVCVMCSYSLGSLVELFHQLEILRHEFNLLRKQVGIKVIVGSLGESEETYETWARDIESVEDVFPYGTVKRLLRTPETAGSSFEVNEDFVKSEDEEEMFAEEPLEFCDYFVGPLVEQKEDPKLTQMRAAVVLRRLDCGILGSQPCVANLDEIIQSTGNSEPTREFSLEELPCLTLECLEEFESAADLPSARKEVKEDFADTKREMWVIAEQLLKNSHPRRTLPTMETTNENEIGKDDDYCANDSDSCSSSVASVKVGHVARTLNRSDKLKLNVSSEKVILCGYCSLTFPTKSSWREHRIRNHSKDSAVLNNSSGREVNEKLTNSQAQVPKVLNQPIEERSLMNKKPIRSRSSRQLEIGDYEDVDVEDNFCEDDSESSRKEYSCGYCELTFQTKLNLLEHWKHIHSLDSDNPKTPKCIYCLRLFLKKHSLLLHLDRVHYGITGKSKSRRKNTNAETFQIRSKKTNYATRIHCFVCDNLQTECYSNLTELQAHADTETHLKQVKLKFNVHCNICRVGFGSDVDALQHHLKSQIHFEEMEMLGEFNKETFCSACRVDCGTSKDLRLHRSSIAHWKTCEVFMGSRVPVNSRHNQNLKCPECPKTFTNRRGIQNHVKRCHKPGVNVCEFCGKVFLNSGDCKSHKKIHNVPRPFSCTECHRAFETEKQLSTHNFTHHSRTSLVCPTCGERFYRRTCLQKHERKHLSTEERKRYKCSYTDCSKTFGFPNKLRRHKYIDHKDDVLKETPCVCLVCFKGFKIVDELKLHMDAHDDLKCYFCGKYFQMITNLENHLRVHFGEKPYSCTYCNKRFGARQNMNGHIKRHIAMDKKQMKVTSPDK